MTPTSPAIDRLIRRLLVLLLSSGVATGCGCSDDSVWSPSVSKLVLSRAGGFQGPSQPTADCPYAGEEYTLLVASRTLDAWRCTASPDAPYPLVRESVSRTLSAAEFDALVPALEALKVVNVDSCGADKPAVLVTVTTPSDTIEYADSFYSCNHDDTRPTLDTDALDRAAVAFARPAFPG
jgi:hypothetical protein